MIRLPQRARPANLWRTTIRLLATGQWRSRAYNHGLGGVRRAMRQFGDTNYVDILRNYKGRTFGFASRNFYVAFLAAMEVDQNVEKYFPGLVHETPTNYSVTTLDSYVEVDGLIRALGISERKTCRPQPGAAVDGMAGQQTLAERLRASPARQHDVEAAQRGDRGIARGRRICKTTARPVPHGCPRRHAVTDCRDLRHSRIHARFAEQPVQQPSYSRRSTIAIACRRSPHRPPSLRQHRTPRSAKSLRPSLSPA